MQQEAVLHALRCGQEVSKIHVDDQFTLWLPVSEKDRTQTQRGTTFRPERVYIERKPAQKRSRTLSVR